ncbi:MAG: HAD family hydrolase [Deltaproteobacteria bacterium]|nr:HAD family hydrolase [Deltaproteobacteria bacterium]
MITQWQKGGIRGKNLNMDLGSPVTHLLVDLDGTLLGNRSLALGVDFARQAVKRMTTYTSWRRGVKILLEMNREFGRVSPDITNDIRVVEIFAKRLKMPADEARKVLRESLFVIFPGLEKHFYPMPGAKDFLDWAKERYTLILATNPVWPPEIIELRVKWAGVDPKIFADITHVRAMRSCKPTREYYQQILSAHTLEAESCLLIGNDVKMDLPATRVGIRTFIVGKYKKSTALRLKGAKADAWRGAFPHLKTALADQR